MHTVGVDGWLWTVHIVHKNVSKHTLTAWWILLEGEG